MARTRSTKEEIEQRDENRDAALFASNRVERRWCLVHQTTGERPGLLLRALSSLSLSGRTRDSLSLVFAFLSLFSSLFFSPPLRPCSPFFPGEARKGASIRARTIDDSSFSLKRYEAVVGGRGRSRRETERLKPGRKAHVSFTRRKLPTKARSLSSFLCAF